MDKSPKIIKCLIMDDEPLAVEIIGRYIRRVPSLRLVAQCENAIQALTILQQQEIDLLFADIRMPELLGTDLIRILQHPPRVIITTAYAEYALEGYDLDIVDYLLKPIRFERFLKAIDKLFKKEGAPSEPRAPQADHGTPQADSVASSPGRPDPAPGATPRPTPDPINEDYLYLRTDRKMVRVMLDTILCIEGRKNYVKILTGNGPLMIKNSMSAMAAMLPEGRFIRVHRSYIVATAKIDSFTPDSIEIRDIKIPVGKLYKNAFLKSISSLHGPL
jgi:two-component system LytT family response regulator